MSEQLKSIQHPRIREHYDRELFGWLRDRFAEVFGWNKPQKIWKKGVRPKPYVAAIQVSPRLISSLNPHQCEKELLAHLINHPSLLKYDEEVVLSVNFENPVYASLANELVRRFRVDGIQTADEMLATISGKGFDSQIEHILQSVISLTGTAKKTRPLDEAEEGFWASIVELRRLNQISEIRLDFVEMKDLNDPKAVEVFDKLKWIAQRFAAVGAETARGGRCCWSGPWPITRTFWRNIARLSPECRWRAPNLTDYAMKS